MDKNTAIHVRNILDAYINGKTIQHYGLIPPVAIEAEREYGWYDINYTELWNGLCTNPDYFRVKEEKGLVPFNNGKEFMDALQKHGGYVYDKNKSTGYYCLPSLIINDGVYMSDSYMSYFDMSRNWAFADGTPCGKTNKDQ